MKRPLQNSSDNLKIMRRTNNPRLPPPLVPCLRRQVQGRQGAHPEAAARGYGGLRCHHRRARQLLHPGAAGVIPGGRRSRGQPRQAPVVQEHRDDCRRVDTRVAFGLSGAHAGMALVLAHGPLLSDSASSF
jgi:hypothetical protein